MAKYNIHAGHNPDGKVACGAVGIIKESTQARKVKEYVCNFLREEGHYAYDCTCNDGRNPGDTPYTLFDYFPDDFLVLVDESHMTIPQVRAMYNGDKARKDALVEYGFRLKSAYDNRPLKFDEFENKYSQMICISATKTASF